MVSVQVSDVPLLVRPGGCHWCLRPGPYAEGTTCTHGQPPVGCAIHGALTDLNLVARGRRAVVKCAHHGSAFVALYADPIGDDKERGSYTVHFAMSGVGSEVYQIPAQRHQCPHEVFDRLVGEMRAGIRPSQNRVPNPATRVAPPGQELPHGE